MKIKEIQLVNYRKYKNSSFFFGDNINIIYGDNATGKSTILEAIQYIGTLRSNKTSSDFDIVKIGESESVVKARFQEENEQKKAIVLISKYYKKMSIDNLLIKKASDFIGFVNIVSFSSDDVHAVSGSPSERRKMFDMFFCQYDVEYMKMLKDYKKCLKERNITLKETDFTKQHNLVLLDVLDGQLKQITDKLVKKRRLLISCVNDVIADIHKNLANKEEMCQIKYISSYDENAKTNYFIENRNKDISMKTTTLGPHRDDFMFCINDLNLVNFGSQGQKKTAMLSFKLTNVKMFIDKKDSKPIILLDDVFGELDSRRQNNVLSYIDKDIQTVITTPGLTDLSEELIKNSHVIYLEKEE